MIPTGGSILNHVEPANASGDDSPSGGGYEELVVSIRKQTEALERLLEAYVDGNGRKASGSTSNVGEGLSHEILEVLRKIYEKQVASDVSKQPIPPAPSATSSAAWSPLLRSHLDQIQPIVDRWRGTLDTILVFIALFSAIVTTFFVQSLTGLSQDPGDRTNELLQNLTEIIISISPVNVAQLNIPSPTPFQPEGSAVRLNFYWSISLILSICVAALAVTSRGYVGMLNRSHHTHAHKKLGDLHRRWAEANKVLAPAIEFLPQLLILPVVLFVVGLLDNVISSSMPLSEPYYPIFIAGLLSCVFAIAVAMYTVFTVFHGWLYPDISPFQSTFVQLALLHWPSAIDLIKRVYHDCLRVFRSWTRKCMVMSDHSQDSIEANAEQSPQDCTSTHGSRRTNYLLPASMPAPALELRDVEAFHAALQQVYEDDVIDQAVAAFPALTAECLRSRFITVRPRVPHWQFHFDSMALRYSTVPPFLFLETYEIASLCYMLSDEASVRTNITAATFIADPPSSSSSVISNVDSPTLHYTVPDASNLLLLLMRSAERYSMSTKGEPHSYVLWRSPFISAMLMLVSSTCGVQNPPVGRMTSRDAPVVGLLLANIPESDDTKRSTEKFSRMMLIEFLWNILDSEVRRSASQSGLQHAREGEADHLKRLNLGYMSSYLCELVVSQHVDFQRYFAEVMARGLNLKNSGYMYASFAPHALVRWLFFQCYPAKHLPLGEICHGFRRALHLLRINVARYNPGKEQYVHPEILNDFRWLHFLLKETNSIIARASSDGYQFNDGLRLDFLNTCIDLIRFLQDFDNSDCSNDNGTCFSSPFDHDGENCTALCGFRTELLHSVGLLQDKAWHGKTLLDETSWLRLENILTGSSSVHVRWATWTTVSHRDEVKRSILAAFRKLVPTIPGTIQAERDNSVYVPAI